MNRFFQSLGASVLLALGLQMMAPAFAYAFTDVGASTKYATAINALQTKGVLQGYTDATFKPSAHINRAEFSKIVAAAVYKSDDIDHCAAINAPLKDMQKDEWYTKYVCMLRNKGAISGYPDGTFKPDQDITFAEATKILSFAYNVQIQDVGNEWYEGFVRAFESSKAIPQSVVKLDSAITRGEMAEMMWRLSENKTDQPSKGLLNLEHPELTINTASDSIQYAKSCAELQTFAAQPSITNQNLNIRGGGMMEDMAMPTAGNAAGAPAMAEQSKTENTDHSNTNLQVAGVDEGDIVKTDGTFLYSVSRTQPPVVRIIQATPASAMKVVSTIDLSAKGFTPSEVYVDDGTLMLVGQTNGGEGYPVPMGATTKMMAPRYMPYRTSQTMVVLYDISDPSNPKQTRTVSFDGNSISTRRINNKLYLVLQQGFRYWGDPRIMNANGATEEKTVPQFEDSKTGKTMDIAPCAKIAIMPRVPSPQYMTVAVVPTNDLTKDVQSTVILGDAQNVYASLQNLYVATTRWNYVWDSARSESNEQTHLYRFAFTDKGVELKAQGDAPGHILNQFSMDENGSTFRIATTSGQSWNEQMQSSNNLYVLNMDLQQTGSVTGIAPGETMYSVRFAGDRAYMVTFKNIDPFFVIDLKDPRAPKILGNLKIPGFSNYLEPYDATHVIGFGKDADESIDADKVHSTDAIYYTAVQGLKLGLFDVTDPANPKQMAVEVIGDRGTDSPVLTDHKALLFEKDRNLLAFPIMVTKRPVGSSASAEASTVFQGAYVYDLSLSGGFKLRGTVTHYDNTDDFIKAGSYWYGGAQDIQRIVRLGSELLTVSDARVQSNSETTVKEDGRVELK